MFSDTLKMEEEIKQFSHNRIEKCKLSKKDIDTKKDRYAIILDCDSNEITSIGFYRLDMLRDLIKGNGKIIQDSFIERQKKIINQSIGNLLNSPQKLQWQT